jgi:hypothetical protein
MTHAEIKGLRSRESRKTFEKMLVAFGESLGDLASSNDGDEGDDEDDEETELGKLSKDDELDWVMGKITKTIHQPFERFGQKQMKLDELTKPR